METDTNKSLVEYESKHDGLDEIELTEEYFVAHPEKYRYIESTKTWQDRETGRFVRSFGNPHAITPTNAHEMHIRNMELKLKGQELTRHAMARGAKSKTWQEAYVRLNVARYEQANDSSGGMASVKAHELLAELSGLKDDSRYQAPAEQGNMTLIDKLLIVADSVTKDVTDIPSNTIDMSERTIS